MRFYKLEAVQAALRNNGATGRTVVGSARCTEVWERTVKGELFAAFLVWQDADQKLAEEEVGNTLHALFVKPIIHEIESGGLRL